MGIGIVLNFASSGMNSVGLMYLLKEVILVDDFYIGIFRSLIILPMIVTPILFGNFFKRFDDMELMGITTTALSISLLLTGISSYFFLNGSLSKNTSLLIIFIITILSYGILSMYNITFNAMIKSEAPIDAMSRVSTLVSLIMAIMIPIGQLVTGVLFDYLPAYLPFILACIFTFIIRIANNKKFKMKRN